MKSLTICSITLFLAILCDAQSVSYLIKKPGALENFYTNGDLNSIRNSDDFNAWLKDNNGESLNPDAFVNTSEATKYFVVYTALFRTYYFVVNSKKEQKTHLGNLKAFIEENIFKKFPDYKGKIVASSLTIRKGHKVKWGKGPYNLTSTGKYTTGLIIDDKKAEEVESFIPNYNWYNNKLPVRYSLEDKAPTTKNQAGQSSCTGWATAYAGMTILRAINEDKTGDECIMSPAFVYNQMTKGNCDGLFVEDVLAFLKRNGTVPFNDFTYDERNCSRQPNQDLINKAKLYRLSGFQRLFSNSENNKVKKIEAVKQNLLQDNPVIISMYVDNSLMNEESGITTNYWYPTADDYKSIGIKDDGWHALCVIGYDDAKYGDDGGIQILNSWGNEFEKNRGIFWISYEDFNYFVRYSYSMYFSNKKGNKKYKPDFEVAVIVNKKQNKLLKAATGDSYVSSIKANNSFQFRVKNNMPCYTYIFKVNEKMHTIFPGNNQSPEFRIIGDKIVPLISESFLSSENHSDYIVLISGDLLNIENVKKYFSSSGKKEIKEKLDFNGKKFTFIEDNNISDNVINFKADWQKNVINIIHFRINHEK